jgi:hypothetical protein
MKTQEDGYLICAIGFGAYCGGVYPERGLVGTASYSLDTNVGTFEASSDIPVEDPGVSVNKKTPCLYDKYSFVDIGVL